MSNSNSILDLSYLRLLFTDETDGFLNDNMKLADFFPALVFVLNVDNNRLVYTNKQFNTILGYTEEDLSDLEFDWHHIVHTDDQKLFNWELQKSLLLADEDSNSFRHRFIHKKGNWKYFRTRATVLSHKKTASNRYVLFVAQDITEIVYVSEELKRAKEQIGETEKSHRFGMYSYDVIRDLFSWSDGIYALYDVSRESNPNPDYNFFKEFIVPEQREQMEEFKKSVPSETNEYENIFTIQTEKGDIKILLDMVKILRNSKGEIIKYSGSLRDITKEKIFERELQKNIRDLNNSNKELEEFAYVASHDMQEPLRKIITFSTRLQDKFKVLLGEEGKTYLERMNISANNMRILIENLLEISRTSRQDQPFKLVDLNSIFKDTLDVLELSIEEKNVTIVVKNPLPELEAVAPLMLQLFSNLVSNSIKFRSDRQPVITVNTSKISKARKQALLLPEKVFYEITLSDNGIGFEQEFAERVFQIFQRLHGKAEYPGSGIGLSICKKIIEKHNGLIYVESELNKGTTFFIILPEKQ